MSKITYYGFPGIQERYAELRIKTIVGTVAGWYGVTITAMRGKDRHKETCEARHVAMFLLRVRTEMSLKKIGKYFGGRDHTSIVHAYNKVRDLREAYPEFREKIQGFLDGI